MSKMTIEDTIKELNNIKICKYLGYGMGEDFESDVFCKNSSANPENFYYKNLKCRECPDFKELDRKSVL